MVNQRVTLYLNTEILPNSLFNQIPLIVTHNNPIRVLYKSLLNINTEDFESVDTNTKTVYLVTSINNKITIKKLINNN